MTNALEKRKPFREHLDELRSRLFWIAVTLIIGSVAGFVLHERLLTFVLNPLHQTVYYSSPTGGFDFLFKICLFFGFLVSLPVITYHVLLFIQPVFPQQITMRIGTILTASFFLMLLGMSIAYFINIPTALHFFQGFSSTQLHPLIATDDYLSFILTDLVGFGIVFQMPLILLFFNYMYPIRIKSLLQKEKYVIVFGFLMGAIFTPDPLNQTIMALPIILLYQLSLLIIFFVNKKGRKKNTKKKKI